MFTYLFPLQLLWFSPPTCLSADHAVRPTYGNAAASVWLRHFGLKDTWNKIISKSHSSSYVTPKHFKKLYAIADCVLHIFKYLQNQLEYKSTQALRNKVTSVLKKKNASLYNFEVLLAPVLKVYLISTSYHKLWQSALFPWWNCCPYLKPTRKQLSVFVALHTIVCS